MLQRLLVVFSALALVGGLAIWYDSTQPSRVERVVACIEKLGYSTSVYHDDGREPLVDPDSDQDPDIMVLFGDATRQVRPPSTQVRVALLPEGFAETVTVWDAGGRASTEFNGLQPTAGQRAAITAITDCANP